MIYNNKKKILIIEDQLNIRRILSKKLKSLDYQVLTISDGREALKILNFFSPDLIVLDIMLPGINGYDICKEIRKTYMIPIIFLTALSTVGDQVKGFELGANDYIVKPFSLEEIERRILAILIKNNIKEKKSIVLKNDKLIIDLKNRIILNENSSFQLNQIEIEIIKSMMALILSHTTLLLNI